MPGTTDTQGLQFDLLSENVATATETGLERLAKGIATELDAADTARTTALKRPAARAIRFALQSIPNNSTTFVTFDTENIDTHAMIDLGAQPQRVTVSAGGGAGVYQVCARIFDLFTNSTGRVELYLTKNGAELFRQTVYAESNGLCVHGLVQMAVGDYFGVALFQNSGVARDVDTVYLEAWKISQ